MGSKIWGCMYLIMMRGCSYYTCMYTLMRAFACLYVQSTKNATLINTKWPSNFVFELYDARRRSGGKGRLAGAVLRVDLLRLGDRMNCVHVIAFVCVSWFGDPFLWCCVLSQESFCAL